MGFIVAEASFVAFGNSKTIHFMACFAVQGWEPSLALHSVTTLRGQRRVNYYVKHLVQDLDGQPSETLSWLEDYGDPKLISSLDQVIWDT